MGRLEGRGVIHTHVQGGTGAGTRRAPKPKPGPWRCLCLLSPETDGIFRENPGYLVACPDCGTRRP